MAVVVISGLVALLVIICVDQSGMICDVPLKNTSNWLLRAPSPRTRYSTVCPVRALVTVRSLPASSRKVRRSRQGTTATGVGAAVGRSRCTPGGDRPASTVASNAGGSETLHARCARYCSRLQHRRPVSQARGGWCRIGGELGAIQLGVATPGGEQLGVRAALHHSAVLDH